MFKSGQKLICIVQYNEWEEYSYTWKLPEYHEVVIYDGQSENFPGCIYLKGYNEMRFVHDFGISAMTRVCFPENCFREIHDDTVKELASSFKEIKESIDLKPIPTIDYSQKP